VIVTVVPVTSKSAPTATQDDGEPHDTLSGENESGPMTDGVHELPASVVTRAAEEPSPLPTARQRVAELHPGQRPSAGGQGLR